MVNSASSAQEISHPSSGSHSHSQSRQALSHSASPPPILESHSYLNLDANSAPGGAPSQVINTSNSNEGSSFDVTGSNGNSEHEQSDHSHIKVPAYGELHGQTPPPSYSSLPFIYSSVAPLLHSSQIFGNGRRGNAVASGSETFSSAGPSHLAIPQSYQSPSSSSTYGTIPPSSANLYSIPGSNAITYDYAYSPSQATFGPTPMNASHPLLAAPHAEEFIGEPGAPDRRARKRFLGAVFWAVSIILGFSALLGLEILGEVG